MTITVTIVEKAITIFGGNEEKKTWTNLQTHSEMETVVWKKKLKEFCQFRLILPKKRYFIPDFENIWSRE